MIFRRRKDGDPGSDGMDRNGARPDDDASAGPDRGDAGDDSAAVPGQPVDRGSGPYDISEVAEPDAIAAERLDFGAVQVPLVDGLEIRVELDEESNEAMAITLVQGQGAVQVRAFAGPRSGGGWDVVLGDLRSQISSDGGTVDESSGPFGPEIAAAVSGQDEGGNHVVQPIRFIGVDGPRWLLQGVLFGEGADPDLAGGLEAVFRSLVVVRGETAMPVGAALPLSLPERVPGDVDEVGDDDAGPADLDLTERVNSPWEDSRGDDS